MELLKLKVAHCSDENRSDLSQTISNVVAVIVPSMPRDIVILGRVFPQSRSRANDDDVTWWLLGYSVKFHMVFAQAVSGKHSSYIMCKSTILRTVSGAKCTFDTDEWRARVTTDKLFYELGVDSLNDEAILASFITYPPERFNIDLGYSKFILSKVSDSLLPYVTDWVELEFTTDVDFVDIPDGVKHIAITRSLSDTLVRLPDSIVSCYIHKDVAVRLSIPKRFSKTWGYWSAVWGKPYNLREGFSCSPDGLVNVRP